MSLVKKLAAIILFSALAQFLVAAPKTVKFGNFEVDSAGRLGFGEIVLDLQVWNKDWSQAVERGSLKNAEGYPKIEKGASFHSAGTLMANGADKFEYSESLNFPSKDVCEFSAEHNLNTDGYRYVDITFSVPLDECKEGIFFDGKRVEIPEKDESFSRSSKVKNLQVDFADGTVALEGNMDLFIQDNRRFNSSTVSFRIFFRKNPEGKNRVAFKIAYNPHKYSVVDLKKYFNSKLRLSAPLKCHIACTSSTMIDKNGIKKRPLTRPNDLSDSKQRSEACHRRRLRRHCRRIRHRRHTYLDALDVIRKGRVACGKDHRAQRHRDDQHKYDKQKNVYPFHTASEFSILYHIIAQKANHRYIKNFSFTNFQTFEHYSPSVSFRARSSCRFRCKPTWSCRCDRRRSWGELPLSSYQALSFVQVLSRDDVNHFYISIKLVVTSAFYVGCETIRLTEPSSIGRATCDDFAVKSDCVDFLFVVLSFVKR